MTSTGSTTTSVVPPDRAAAPPYSRAVRLGVGTSLVLAGLLNGLPQYLFSVLVGDMTFSEQIAWGAQHDTAQRLEQLALVVSALFMPLGLLGIGQVTRWHAPRLTVVAVPLVLWGMWGFHNVLSMGYVAGTVAPTVLPLQQAVRLNDALPGEAGTVVVALVPHLLGSFLGVLLLTVAAWRSQVFPRVACALVALFLVWDFLLPSAGPLEPHLLLAVGWTWLGVTLLRMPDAVWHGAAASGR